MLGSLACRSATGGVTGGATVTAGMGTLSETRLNGKAFNQHNGDLVCQSGLHPQTDPCPSPKECHARRPAMSHGAEPTRLAGRGPAMIRAARSLRSVLLVLSSTLAQHAQTTACQAGPRRLVDVDLMANKRTNSIDTAVSAA